MFSCRQPVSVTASSPSQPNFASHCQRICTEYHLYDLEHFENLNLFQMLGLFNILPKSVFNLICSKRSLKTKGCS